VSGRNLIPFYYAGLHRNEKAGLIQDIILLKVTGSFLYTTIKSLLFDFL